MSDPEKEPTWWDFAKCRPDGEDRWGRPLGYWQYQVDGDAGIDPHDEAEVFWSAPRSPFFPTVGGPTREAKAICRGCPVRWPCLEYAVRNSQRYGVWGGMSERERRPLMRSLALMEDLRRKSSHTLRVLSDTVGRRVYR